MTNPSIGDLASRVRDAPARCGAMHAVLVDGPAGSGKTTIARRLGTALDAQVLHGDDMYEGWGGLATLDALLLGEILEPLSRGRQASFRRWDWVANERAEAIHVPQAPVLILEGVGIAQRQARPYASLVIFVEAPWEMRIARGLARDGEHMRGEWERWEVEQNAHHEENNTRDAAHVVIDGTAAVLD